MVTAEQYVSYTERMRKNGFFLMATGFVWAMDNDIIGYVNTEEDFKVKVPYVASNTRQFLAAVRFRNFLKDEKIPYTEEISARESLNEFMKVNGLQKILDEAK